jgi:hypothetical protein
VARLFDHGERVEKGGFWEEVVEPFLVEGEQPGGVGELGRLDGNGVLKGGGKYLVSFSLYLEPRRHLAQFGDSLV